MSDQSTKVTPMMAQYLEIKAQYPDALLFYRMGDFYELFFDDAKAAATALDIALTKRGKHDGNDIPMCGVPAHSAEGYLLTLIRKGFKVGVCEQLESPAEAKKRGYKAVVKRDVVRLVTPGTLTEDSLLNARQNNFLCAVTKIRDEHAIAWIDMSTGDLRTTSCKAISLSPELARLAPSEILIADDAYEYWAGLLADYEPLFSPVARSGFDSASSEKRLCDAFSVATLEAFGNFSLANISALGALLNYLDITQKGKIPLLKRPVLEALDGNLLIDAATRHSLEITRTQDGQKDGALLSVMDQTLTAAGGRLLAQRLSNPSRHLSTIEERLDAIDFALSNAAMSSDIRASLKEVADIERALSRISLDRAGPRDFTAIRVGLEKAEGIKAHFADTQLPTLLARTNDDLTGHGALIATLTSTFIDEPPLLARDGGFVAPGCDPELDECRQLRDEGRAVIASLQAQYAQETGIQTLKIKHNNVLGFFVEATSTHADKLLSAPLSEQFIHRQTTANQVRFTTVELSELETKIHNAGGRALEIEKQILQDTRVLILSRAAEIALTARALAEIDVSLGLANLSRDLDWVRPQMDDSRDFVVRGGRHPTVEHALKKANQAAFVSNDCSLDQDSGAGIWLITGPNMAGKSTFLRQNALIALIAQSGSFVPAKSARIGIVSQLFSRVGASDDLTRGRSTFMVEMVETSAILNQADDRALVILDEIGRGTSTYDGLSIAWATFEHLHGVNKCRALFATHYHEMTELCDQLERATNATVSVREHGGELIFMHEVKRGKADRSYGVQVAKLAGLPNSVLARAEEVLKRLEAKSSETHDAPLADLPLFDATPVAPSLPETANPVLEKLAEISPDELTPKQALELLYELKSLD